MFYQKLLSLCSDRGIRITSLVSELHISSGNLSKWKAGNNPKSDTLLKIADYFGVSVDYLLGQEEESERAITFLPERLQEALGNMSCEEFAQKFHYKPKIISDYLEGNRKPLNATLFQIATDLGVNPEWLYGHKGVPKYKKPVPTDGDRLSERERLFMNLVEGLTSDQQQLLLAQLQAWNEQNQRQALAAQQSDGEKSPESAP